MHHDNIYKALYIAIRSYYTCSGDQEHCEVKKVNGSLPLYWDWLKQATYAGQRVVREEMLDVWQQHVSIN